MGSQSVTDFSAAKKKRIRGLLKAYSPDSPEAETQAREIGAVAMGALGTVPANEFLQALSSRSVETGIGLITLLAEQLKRDPQKVYKDLQEASKKATGVASKMRQPVGIISASLTRALSNLLSSSQAETESAFAAKDAISKTIIDVVSAAFPREKEPAEIDRRKFTEAFRSVTREQIVTAFMQNVASSLINLVLDATRGTLPPGEVADLKQRIRERFVPDFTKRLMGQPKIK